MPSRAGPGSGKSREPLAGPGWWAARDRARWGDPLRSIPDERESEAQNAQGQANYRQEHGGGYQPSNEDQNQAGRHHLRWTRRAEVRETPPTLSQLLAAPARHYLADRTLIIDRLQSDPRSELLNCIRCNRSESGPIVPEKRPDVHPVACGSEPRPRRSGHRR